ncbi:DUF1134 domain-containing protein [Sphingomonas sp. BIUV-7]|uniref:DUF1134 domain-containing protein n=1 Tax=Sphingomonas natans TaxID=3063330 RepID=A0ABT8YEE6_9SPHN|nr:DUF1134 domain-containing protein [Sphingomonas sp. BIUV-7]MDO6416724.1 DUF1134 domain-containing protein [Sphingomonas sp. BIUV-7]
MKWLATAAAIGLAGGPAVAQVQTIDPNNAASRAARPSDSPARPEPERVAPPERASPPPPAAPATEHAAAQASADGAYQENDVLAAAEGVFGKGAEGLAKVIERTFKQYGRPDAYIAGREAGAAIAVGVRYGSGTLFHKVEGQRPVYWTGPSLGFDLGANGGKTFVLVYNLYDSQELFNRYPAAEGNLIVIGGFQASYLKRKDVVLVPIRLGVGWRLGANVGYMRFSEKSRWSPF